MATDWLTLQRTARREFDARVAQITDWHARTPATEWDVTDLVWHVVDEQRWIGECPAEMEPGDLVDLGFNYNSDSWPDQPRADNIYESMKVVEKMLNEAIEINKRLGPM